MFPFDSETPALSFKPFASDRASVLPATPYTIGDLLVATGSTALTTLPDVAVGSLFASGGVGALPSWSANPTVTSLTSSVPNVILTTPAGLVAVNPTAATLGVPRQNSPVAKLTGSAFNSVSGLSETDDWFIQARPIDAAGATSVELHFLSRLNGGAIVDVFSVTSGGSLRAQSFLGSNNNGGFQWSANGKVHLDNQAGTVGVGFDVTTDSLLLLRNRAFTAYATLDVLGLKASGVAGFNGTVTPVTAITVVNGIVTNVT